MSNYEADLRPFKVIFEPGEGRYYALDCGYCDFQAKTAANKNLPPEALKASFARKGWRLGGRKTKPTCPKCLAAFRSITKKKGQSMPKIKARVATQAVQIPVPTTPNLRKIFAALETHFDEEGGRYRDGYSDEKIADELGMSEAAVAMVRKESFGALQPPPELAALASECLELGNLVNDFSTRLDRVLKKYG